MKPKKSMRIAKIVLETGLEMMLTVLAFMTVALLAGLMHGASGIRIEWIFK